MKTIEDINKKMPFHEEEAYLDALVNKATESAIAGRSASRRFSFSKIAASIAIMLVAGSAGWMLLQDKTETVAESPLDSFLCHISDEEAEQIIYYDIEDYDIDTYNYETE